MTLQKCDLFLDPPKYNSHTTGADSLWMGVPLLTLPGKRFASRVGSSLLKSLQCKLGDGTDLAELLIVPDLASFEDRAVEMATNEILWANVKTALTTCARKSALFNPQNWMKEWEWALMQAGFSFSSPAKKGHIYVPMAENM